ncbi:nucleoside triphosphate pyrophosphohydrolase [Desulfonatronovibrio hydrogenovorans]|uniref:nucleoside triphosphate pyrophosphohydrolase n=1 Tax=Desulfonatronovibrio hydrogenovorans TaxID=53245 RepID=UPI0004909B90|nr:nucleoside triphosphate pyrophosphohydrolase [Desulfonatronovibrio hydrogenovorans]
MKHKNSLDEVLQVIRTLLGPGGCPWDKEQTPDSLCDYLIEEAFELVSAVRSKDPAEIMEEMGDVFFLLFFMALLHEKDFSLEDVWAKAASKMITRHPHVFRDEQFATREDLMRNWEKVKKEEKTDKNSSTFASIPKNLPPLLMAYRINSKAARSGFTWNNDSEVEEKLAEEWDEFKQARQSRDRGQAEKEFGDYLFTLVEYGRRKGIKANTALSMANSKFLRRVQDMEDLARKKGLDPSGLNMEQMNSLWDEAKAAE